MMRTLGKLLKLDRRGNVMMITAFALIPLTFATGMTIDYSRAARSQTKMNAIADAAALAAVTDPMLKQYFQAACNGARMTFRNQATGLNGVSFDNANLDIAITETYASIADATITCSKNTMTVPGTGVLPTSRNARVTYRATSNNTFARVLGSSSIEIGGTSATRASQAPFIDIHVALDTSQSMGLAATDTDAIALWNLTKSVNGNSKGCTFGCHAFVVNGAESGKNTARTSNETLANSNGIRMRIDVLRDASRDMIQSAIDEQGSRDLYQFGLYRIGDATSTISPLSNNLTAAKSTIGTLKLGPNNEHGRGDTNLNEMLRAMANTITGNGDGTTRAKANAFLFIVTDGVIDIFTAASSYNAHGVSYSCRVARWDHCTAPIDPTTCQILKDKNITIGVIYTTYHPVYNDPQNTALGLRGEYTAFVSPFASEIGPKLQACSSDPARWYFEAADGPAIQTAMRKLFSQVTEAQRLTD